MKAKKLSFRATRVSAEVDSDAQSLLFEIEREGDATVYFGLASEPAGGVRVTWGDGKKTGGHVVEVTSPALDKAKLKLDYAKPDAEKLGPYTGVEVTFEELEPELAADVSEAFELLFAPKKKKAPVALPEGVLKRGTPQLGVLAASRDEWKVAPGKDATLELIVSNTGGAVGGLTLELGGPAIVSGHLEAREASAGGKAAKFEKNRVALDHAKVDGDYDIDRKAAGKDAPKPPTLALSVVVRGKTAGRALVTIRVTPKTADGRGSAMVGRTIVIE